MDRIARIISSMVDDSMVGNPEQLGQVEYRMALVDGWGIGAGASVLEIGCGQGDMTAVLAEAVGPEGRVVAVDNAPPTYGMPVTVAESSAFLMASEIGRHVDIRLEVDLLSGTTSFGDDEFDHVVFSHCGWFFSSVPRLRSVFELVRPWARRLCFAEWDLRPSSLDQLPHLLAVLLEGHIEASGSRGDNDVRTPFSRERAKRELSEAGWQVLSERDADTAGMRDADWTIEGCVGIVEDEARMAKLSDAARIFVDSQADTLTSLASPRGNVPLGSYALLAERR
jgi:SAM-dependent methyltransferase